MSLTLYYAPGACSFVPHSLLEMAGATFEPQLVKLHKNEQNSPEYKAINPRGQVPVLVVDGKPLTQIVAIVGYIDARFPQAGLLPTDPFERAKALELLAWMNNSVHPTFTHFFRPEKFAAEDSTQALIKSHAATSYKPLLQELDALAARAQAEGRGFLVGDSFGPADAYALVLLRWGGFAGHDPEGFPALWAHVQKVAALPGVARTIERERLVLNVYKPA